MIEEEVEKPSEESGEVRRWFKEIELADKAEKDWREAAKEAIKAYESDPVGGRATGGNGGEKTRTFNILWSNVEIKRQAIYSALPDPDIRRRWRDEDKVGKAVAQVLERCATYILDCKDVDGDLIAATNDMLLPGRAVTRLRLRSDLDEDGTVNSQDLDTEQVQWDKFKRGPGKTWDEVPWICFEHDLYKDEVEERWGAEIANQLDYRAIASESDSQQNDQGDEIKTVFSRAVIWEIWDKAEKKVRWIAKSLKDKYLEVDDDPYNLRGFWPIPRPLYAVENSTSLCPQTEYSKYQVLAEELEIVTRRRNKIASALRVRGVYDSTLAEIPQLLESGDNRMIPAENASKYAEMGKGLDNAIWMLPIRDLVEVYQVLGVQRNELIGQIYEITGISDIVRGDTNPNETATAQKIKGNFASLRLEKQKAAAYKYARDLVRLVVEVVAEKFDRSTLERMSGLKFPTQEEKQMAQMLMQQNEIAPGIIPEQQIKHAQELLQSEDPTWDEIQAVMQDDLERDYRIDIETDSSISIDKQRDQATMAEFINGMSNFGKMLEGFGSMGLVTPEAAKKMMVAMARRFEMGREVEDELEKEAPPKQGPSPEEVKAQAEQQKAQMEQQTAQMKAQIEERMAQIEAATEQREAQLREREAVLEYRLKELEAQTEARRLANKDAYEQRKHERDMEKLSAQPQ